VPGKGGGGKRESGQPGVHRGTVLQQVQHTSIRAGLLHTARRPWPDIEAKEGGAYIGEESRGEGKGVYCAANPPAFSNLLRSRMKRGRFKGKRGREKVLWREGGGGKKTLGGSGASSSTLPSLSREALG